MRLSIGSGQLKSECIAFSALTKSSTLAARNLTTNMLQVNNAYPIVTDGFRLYRVPSKYELIGRLLFVLLSIYIQESCKQLISDRGKKVT